MNRARDTSWGSTPPEATKACPVCGQGMPAYRRECSPRCLVLKVREKGLAVEPPGRPSAPAAAREARDLAARPPRVPGTPVPTTAPCLCCGERIDVTPPHQSRRYCRPCAAERNRAAEARSKAGARARAQTVEPSSRVCQGCQEPLPVLAPMQRRYCDHCRMERERARQRAVYHDKAARRRAGGEG